MTDIILALVILAIVGGAVRYIYKSHKTQNLLIKVFTSLSLLDKFTIHFPQFTFPGLREDHRSRY